jgi:hypothetical protein
MFELVRSAWAVPAAEFAEGLTGSIFSIWELFQALTGCSDGWCVWRFGKVKSEPE